MINIGVIGYGYWGPNLVRNFAEVARVRLASVANSSPEKLGLVQRRFPMVRATADFHDLLRDPEIDAIAVATPVSTHFELGMAVLKAGKHLWLEKPMTETSLQARQLIDEAGQAQLGAVCGSHVCLHGRRSQDAAHCTVAVNWENFSIMTAPE